MEVELQRSKQALLSFIRTLKLSKSVYDNGKGSLESLRVSNLVVLLTFYTWGPHRARDFCGAVRAPPQGQAIIQAGIGLVGVCDKVPLPGVGSSHCFSRWHHRRAKAGSCFHPSLRARRYRLFSTGSVVQSCAFSSFTQLRALSCNAAHTAAMMEKMNQPEILLCQKGTLS